MKRTPSLTLAITALVACTCVPTPSSAQVFVEPRVPQGIFGVARGDNQATTKFDVLVSLLQGYDTDVPEALLPSIDSANPQSGGFSTSLNAAGTYTWQGRRVQVGAMANSAFRHYAELGSTRSVGHSAGAGVDVKMPGRMNLLVNQSAAFSPAYFYDLFPTGAVLEPGDAGLTAPDYLVSDRESYLYVTTATLRHDFSRRTSLSTIGDFLYTDRLRETPGWQDVSAYSVRSRYERNVTRDVAIAGQARYRSGQFGYSAVGITTEFGVDFGLDYNRQLSATRRFEVRLNVGLSGADYPQLDPQLAGFRRQYMGVGDVTVSYALGRTWDVRGTYERGLDYVTDLPTPVFSDSFSIGTAGLLTRRIDLLASAGYSSGASALNQGSLLFDTYTGNLKLRFALAGNFAVHAEYLYYFYEFREGAVLLRGIPPGFERSGVRVGLTMFVPALRK